MSAKSVRRQAREAVAGYHEAMLAELVAHVAEAIDRFRADELDAFTVDRVLFQYSRAAWELWKFCNMTNVEIAPRQLNERRSIDWWERRAPKAATKAPPTDEPSSAGRGALHGRAAGGGHSPSWFDWRAPESQA